MPSFFRFIFLSLFLLFTTAAFAGFSGDSIKARKSCNGYPELCDKRYDQIVQVTTHNAFNFNDNSSPFLFPNQDFSITKQLNDGVRAFMLDVYPQKKKGLRDQACVFHGFKWTGSESFQSILREIKLFLDANPNELVTLILECYISDQLVSESFETAGLNQYLYSHSPGAAWQTMHEIIESGKRLIIFSDKKENSFSWYHYLWDYCVETGYSVHDADDFSCECNRGKTENSLFILNHFVTNVFGMGRPGSAAEVNSSPFLINRINECSGTIKKIPNFLTVDFYSRGDVFNVAKELNGIK